MDRHSEAIAPAVVAKGLIKGSLHRGDLGVFDFAPEKWCDTSAGLNGKGIDFNPAVLIVKFKPVLRPSDEEKSVTAVLADAEPGTAGRAIESHFFDGSEKIFDRHRSGFRLTSFDES